MTRAAVRETSVDLAGREVPVRITRNRRARRIILRIDHGREGGDGVSITLPNRTSQAEGLDFLREKADWILARLAGLPPRMPFSDGAVVPLGGVEHVIRAVPLGRGAVRREGTEILVSGRAEHLARRLRDWLRAEARHAIQPLVRFKAEALGREPGRITIRDTRSRWGSCSHDGNLSFCWRLVMAPGQVMDYVVAHEVAHLAEHNHGPLFWQAVARLTADIDGPREWLRSHGESLHRYG